MYITEESEIGVGDMKIPTFYATELEEIGDFGPRLICISVVGGVFGGIHCVGWFFDFPSSAEAMLWRVSSAVLTGIAFLLPIILIVVVLVSNFLNLSSSLDDVFAVAVFTIFILVYVVSRLLLLVEAFISLRHLTPGMLALVKWTSFIPHI
jgi:hypothetical protein